eukprot:330594-Chlamydomonas_euryale.AAC.8
MCGGGYDLRLATRLPLTQAVVYGDHGHGPPRTARGTTATTASFAPLDATSRPTADWCANRRVTACRQAAAQLAQVRAQKCRRGRSVLGLARTRRACVLRTNGCLQFGSAHAAVAWRRLWDRRPRRQAEEGDGSSLVLFAGKGPNPVDDFSRLATK